MTSPQDDAEILTTAKTFAGAKPVNVVTPVHLFATKGYCVLFYYDDQNTEIDPNESGETALLIPKKMPVLIAVAKDIKGLLGEAMLYAGIEEIERPTIGIPKTFEELQRLFADIDAVSGEYEIVDDVSHEELFGEGEIDPDNPRGSIPELQERIKQSRFIETFSARHPSDFPFTIVGLDQTPSHVPMQVSVYQDLVSKRYFGAVHVQKWMHDMVAAAGHDPDKVILHAGEKIVDTSCLRLDLHLSDWDEPPDDVHVMASARSAFGHQYRELLHNMHNNPAFIDQVEALHADKEAKFARFAQWAEYALYVQPFRAELALEELVDQITARGCDFGMKFGSTVEIAFRSRNFGATQTLVGPQTIEPWQSVEPLKIFDVAVAQAMQTWQHLGSGRSLN